MHFAFELFSHVGSSRSQGSVALQNHEHGKQYGKRDQHDECGKRRCRRRQSLSYRESVPAQSDS